MIELPFNWVDNNFSIAKITDDALMATNEHVYIFNKDH